MLHPKFVDFTVKTERRASEECREILCEMIARKFVREIPDFEVLVERSNPREIEEQRREGDVIERESNDKHQPRENSHFRSHFDQATTKTFVRQTSTLNS